MATTIPELDQKHEADPALSNATMFEDRVHESLKTRPFFCIYAAILAAFFVFMSYMPLMYTDLWGHLAYGRVIVETGSIPATEPLMPLAAGQPFVDTAWLTQVLGFHFYDWAGPPAMQFLYSLSITSCLVLLTYAIYRRTGDWLTPVIAWCAFLWVEWQQLEIVRPQLAGLLFFVVLFTVLTSRRWHKAYWVAVPLMFTMWANMHGSFPAGLVLIATFCVGRFVDLWLRTKNYKAALADITVRRLFMLVELAAIAVLINPYGLGLYTEVIAFGGNPNLGALTEWSPLTLRMKQGKAAAAVAMALILVYRFTPRRISVVEPLLLAGLGAAALWTSRMIMWWGPVAAYYLAIHINAIRVRRQRRRLKAYEDDPFGDYRPAPAGIWSVGSLGIIWIAFAVSTFGNRMLHGQVLDLEKYVSNQTPIAAVEHLNEHPPEGQLFNTYEWGDYLLWAGNDLKVYVGSHAHLLPEYIWRHYFSISRNGGNWKSSLERYGVNTVIADKAFHQGFIDDVREDNEVWTVDYEDNIAVIFRRIKPITDKPDDPNAKPVHSHAAH